MIVIMGEGPAALQHLAVSEMERSVIRAKQSSPVTYRYGSRDALLFELRMRSQTVKAALDLNESGVSFETFADSYCNEQLWRRTPNGGFLLRPGVAPAVGIRDIFENGRLYGFECATAMVIVVYKAILEAAGERMFNTYFQALFLWQWQYDRDLRFLPTTLQESYLGDIVYFRNPDHDPAHPEWQGENAIILPDQLYYGHGFSIRTADQMIAALNALRRPGSQVSAYLTQDVIYPDFEYLRSLAEGRWVAARIGERFHRA
ncbi:protein-glutamine gamma-glutamyltransferase [Xylanibacillus composti]|uniref:Protein-glutamine gamma-glutamyltransferase n=1 Tax=Xylanibacillus composti TaxID=1572762 RepID=A0A8J4GYZ5_9BACL|nr:protein-glutamine gamma-glutamyltransferase [Xylanibacillus composti]MDT9723938.1 protein-glutamine gamma-glutamyltransferase [Xylanibacillus composti]GIQ67817.1 hypothetical protein XYCOK13_06410 [Xylanibacillus composti]